MSKRQITLGELIALLSTRDPKSGVDFDFGSLEPDSVESYRGYYDELAIGFAEDGKLNKVGLLLAELRAAVGKTFEGYKGGEYVMRADTPVWSANYGKTGSTAIVGLCDCNYWTIIKTKWIDR